MPPKWPQRPSKTPPKTPSEAHLGQRVCQSTLFRKTPKNAQTSSPNCLPQGPQKDPRKTPRKLKVGSRMLCRRCVGHTSHGYQKHTVNHKISVRVCRSQRNPKMTLKWHPRRPKRHPKGPKSSQEAPKRPQEAPKSPQEAPKSPQEAPRRPQDAPKRSKMDFNMLFSDLAPTGPQRAPSNPSDKLLGITPLVFD